MREHFSAGVIVVEGDLPENDGASSIYRTYHGGYAAAIGLLVIGRDRLLKDKHE